ncbi:heat shock protein 81-1-like [Iris pallida]|uniref:Heat shock protein 81-1-like n=1 Tax=Iris pallida TaxID=29817 RepID=A0AAX6HMW0_IRIPA|nr:heat shock protein 81-1-like [Iris pallida]
MNAATLSLLRNPNPNFLAFLSIGHGSRAGDVHFPGGDQPAVEPDHQHLLL